MSSIPVNMGHRWIGYIFDWSYASTRVVGEKLNGVDVEERGVGEVLTCPYPCMCWNLTNKKNEGRAINRMLFLCL